MYVVDAIKMCPGSEHKAIGRPVSVDSTRKNTFTALQSVSNKWLPNQWPRELNPVRACFM